MTVVCQDLFKVHRTHEGDAAALQGLSIEAAAGEMLAVLGPSGSGKSTLLRIVAGLERPSAGSAIVAGNDMGRLSGRRRAHVRRDTIGIVGQHTELALSPALTVGEAIALPLRIRGAGRAAARRRASELIREVGLADAVLAARIGELSGGERQRAAVCAAVAHRPPVILADEPTGELDAASGRDVLELLRGLATNAGATVLLVTHDPAGAAIADRVVRIRDGRVSAEGHGDERAVVIGRGGWLHVPEELLDAAGIGTRARVRAEPGAVVLEPAGAAEHSRTGDTPAAATAGHPRIEGLAVAARGVDKRYGSRDVFRAFDATFPAGTFTTVSGRSGSGKSTLLAMLAGLVRPDAGEVVVGDLALQLLPREALALARSERVGFVAQEPRLAPFLSAAEQVALPLTLDGADRRAALATAATWLGAVGLAERAEQRVARLSAGERQRVAIARALATGRGLLLVDEPTSRLDEASAVEVSLLLARAATDFGVTVICATHDAVVIDAAPRGIAL